MVGVAALLAALTIAGAMTPWLLLALTFAISAGDALELPYVASPLAGAGAESGAGRRHRP